MLHVYQDITQSPQWWPLLLGASAAVAAIVLLVLVWLIARSTREPARGNTLTPAQQRSIERDVAGLMEEFAAMARQVGRQLDERSQRLASLIEQADGRIERIERLENSDSAAPSSAPIVRKPMALTRDEPAPARAQVDPRHAEIYALADNGLAIAEIARRLSRPSGEIELILALRPRRSA